MYSISQYVSLASFFVLSLFMPLCMIGINAAKSTTLYQKRKVFFVIIYNLWLISATSVFCLIPFEEII